MSAATTIAQAFGEEANLYTVVLGIDIEGDTAAITPSQLRKAYYRRALKFHPDKQNTSAPSKDLHDAKLRFQAVSVAYTILSDPKKRKEYDSTGELFDDDEDGLGSSSSGTEAWKNLFKGMFGSVTTKDIDRFTISYKCSEEEEKDVLKYYTQFKGNLNKMLECVMCSDEIDKKRWVEDYIRPAIDEGIVVDFTSELETTLGDDDEIQKSSSSGDTTDTDDSDDPRPTKRKASGKKRPAVAVKRQRRKPKKEAPPDEDLIAAIRGRSNAQREQIFGNLMTGLEERYSSSTSNRRRQSKKGKKNTDDIPDDEFEKIQSRLEEHRKKGR